MSTISHDFVTVDMRGLKAALVARAHAERVSVSVLVRRAVARELGLIESPETETPFDSSASAPTSTTVKLSIRFTQAEAVQLAAGARAAGLSRGAYLAGLIGGVAALSSGASRADHLAALVASSAELSTLSRDIHRLTSLLRQGNVRAAQEYRERLDTLAGDVRNHLSLAAGVLADLRPRGRPCRCIESPGPVTDRRTAMSQAANIDGVLIQWGERLFYPGNRVVKTKPQPKLGANAARQRAAAIRERIEATVVRRAPQVMVKVTGGGRGMKAIAAHFRYISKNGRLDIEDERGETMRGKDTLPELADDWHFGGTLINDVGDRREAFNIMLSMPRGTDPSAVQKAAREFARIELADHKYVMVLHDHQANPHVHLSVRAESKRGKRLNPRKADLNRWRETFAEKLRGHGVEAEASRQATRGRIRDYESLWRVKARVDGRLRTSQPVARSSANARSALADAVAAWMEVGRALGTSTDRADRDLARSIASFVQEMSSTTPSAAPSRVPAMEPVLKPVDIELRR